MPPTSAIAITLNGGRTVCAATLREKSRAKAAMRKGRRDAQYGSRVTKRYPCDRRNAETSVLDITLGKGFCFIQTNLTKPRPEVSDEDGTVQMLRAHSNRCVN